MNSDRTPRDSGISLSKTIEGHTPTCSACGYGWHQGNAGRSSQTQLMPPRGQECPGEPCKTESKPAKSQLCVSAKNIGFCWSHRKTIWSCRPLDLGSGIAIPILCHEAGPASVRRPRRFAHLTRLRNAASIFPISRFPLKFLVSLFFVSTRALVRREPYRRIL